MDKVHIKITLGGAFIPSLVGKKRRVLTWDGGWVYWMKNITVSKIDVHFLREAAIHGFVYANVRVPKGFNCWYKQKGKSWVSGKRELVSDDEVKGFLETVNEEGAVEMYVTSHEPIEGSDKTPFKIIHGNELTSKERSNLRKKLGGPKTIGTSPIVSKHTEEAVRRSPRLKGVVIHDKEVEDSSHKVTTAVERVRAKDKGKVKVVQGATVRLSTEEKGKGKLSEETVGVGSGAGETRKEGRGKKLVFDDEFEDGEGQTESSDSDLSDLDLEWEEGEEDLYEDEDEDNEEWLRKNLEHLRSEVNGSLRGVGEQGELRDDDEVNDPRFDIDTNLKSIEVRFEEEVDADSDELRSLDGDSDDDSSHYSWFNAETDFDKPIHFEVGLRFSNVQVVRKALRQHAIENRYEYYLLHNDSKRISAYCRRRCSCVYNKKSCRLVQCTCVRGVKCRFKFYASRLVKSEAWQIKSLRLKHRCVRTKMNKKVTAEFLADKYLEEFRSNPGWKIRQIQERAVNDLGIKVGYYKAWLARSRAKLIIYGSAAEQYARVWDYGKAFLKYNPGSSCNVVVDGMDQIQRPIFMRMYVCLSPVSFGFVSGCRPIIGVDGCHLKGAYPGQILVAVGKDGNNNIFPIAWATAEIENKETWVWFLESLLKSFGCFDEGLGLTFMSDRQKGLLEAFEVVAPKAELRFCVRHIWANFKLQFHGSTFKELFWAAARAGTLAEFEVAMESINFLDEEAYEYLLNIPPHHWSRHAFSTNCKSNMLLNNMCETFNAVIREARDKPILTQMEWLRRYMMKRINEKWEAASKWEGLLTPYVYRLFDGLEKYARACTVYASRGDNYEVQYKDDQCTVDLQARTCTCYRWELTGIPCVHAYACILDRRDDPEMFVHTHYYRVTYLDAFQYPIEPMPGPKHWERVKLRQPLPPVLKVQPGRPKSKKRKLEQGEGTSAATQQGKKQKVKKQCANCGGFGHYAKTCEKPPAPEQPQQPASNPQGGRPELHTTWMKDQRKKREQKAARQAALRMPLSQPSTTPASQPSTASASQSQPSTRTTRSKNKSLSQPTPVLTSQPPQASAQTRPKLPVTRSKTKNLSSL